MQENLPMKESLLNTNRGKRFWSFCKLWRTTADLLV